MTTSFKSTSSGDISDDTFLSSPLMLVSSSAADTGNITVTGLDAASSPAAQVTALTGKKEVLVTGNWTQVLSCTPAAAQAGAVSLYKEGTKGSAFCYLFSQPSDGDTVIIGLTGFTQTFPFRAKAQSTFVCKAGNDISTGEYFDISLSGTTHRFWYDVNSGGSTPADPGGGLHEIDIAADVDEVSSVEIVTVTGIGGKYFDLEDDDGPVRVWCDIDDGSTPPSTPSGGRLLEVDIASTDTLAQALDKFQAAIDGDSEFGCTDDNTDTLTITNATAGPRTDVSEPDSAAYFDVSTTTQGITGSTAGEVATATEAVVEAISNLSSSVASDTVTVDYEVLGVLTVTDGAGDVLGTVTAVRAGTADAANQVAIGSSVNDTATNLKKAINDEGTEGTHYGTGTAANAYVTATVAGAILTLTDRIGCSRSLGWANSVTGTAASISALSGGENGDLIASIGAGEGGVFNDIDLDDEDVDQGLLPPLLNWTSDPIRVYGAGFSIHLKSSDVTTAMAAKYQYSTEADPQETRWRDGISSITSLDNNSQIITPAEHVEWVRLNINNTNSSPASVNAKCIIAPVSVHLMEVE